MTVAVQTSYNAYTANGVTTVFPYTFKALDADSIVVRLDGGTPLVLGVDYTLSGLGSDAGGNVTMTVAPANGVAVSIARSQPLRRLVDYQQGGDWRAETVNPDFDRLWLALQDLVSGGTVPPNILRGPVGESLDQLPAAALRALQFVGFDAAGQVIVAQPAGAPVSAAMQPVTAAATLLAARQALGVLTESMATGCILGRQTAGTGPAEQLPPAQARSVLGLTSPVIDRAYAEYTTNADLTSVIPGDDTIPQNNEGTQILSVTLTPKSVTNRVRIRFQGWGTVAVTGVTMAAAAFSSASANALRACLGTPGTAGYLTPVVLEHEYVPGTTTALTFTVRVGPQTAGTMRLNGNVAGRFFGGAAAATLVVEEIAA